MERHVGRVPAAAFGDLPHDALLTANDVAEWLKVARRQVQRLGIPWIGLGRKTPRYQVKDVLAWLETRRRDGGLRRPQGARPAKPLLSSGVVLPSFADSPDVASWLL